MVCITMILTCILLIVDPKMPRDILFQRAVEEFCAASCPRTIPPDPYRDILERLGGSKWRMRQEASDEMLAASYRDIRWLFWGMSSHDPEVRTRCNAIMKWMIRCHFCNGSGDCPGSKFVRIWNDDLRCTMCSNTKRIHNSKEWPQCPVCSGIGYHLPRY
jgi:hypothetical protein